MTKEEYLSLCKKYISGNCTPEEEEVVLKYHDDLNLYEYKWDDDAMGIKEVNKTEIFELIEKKIKHRAINFNWAAIAAILVVFLSAGLYFFSKQQTPIVAVKKQRTNQSNDILPGSSKAILTLADGSKITLDSLKSGILAKQGNTAINKTAEGQLSYISVNSGVSSTASQLNTITTPPGGQYQVVLPDETKVWLNAASSLRFPTAFGSKERIVELSGEAYFEVAKNPSAPFKVKAANATVEVLGTHFNVMAYPDENSIKTTLLEGSVEFSNNSIKKMLKPGQEGSLETDGSIGVKGVNTEDAVAWKNGFFIFNKTDIQTIMRQLSRWYGIKVVYQGVIPKDLFVGKISRNEKLSEVIRLLELTNMRFKLEGNIITIL